MSFKDDKDNIIVIVSLFGVAVYKVVICSFDKNICINNLIFQKLILDGSNSIIIKKSINDLYEEINYKESEFIFYNDSYFVYDFINLLKNLCNDIEYDVNKILQSNIYALLDQVFLYKKSIKRFVKDYLYDKEKIKNINPNIKDKDAIIKLYVVMLVGKNNAKINDNNYFYELVRKNINENNTLDDELVQFIKNEVTNYENINFIMKGIDIINEWE